MAGSTPAKFFSGTFTWFADDCGIKRPLCLLPAARLHNQPPAYPQRPLCFISGLIPVEVVVECFFLADDLPALFCLVLLGSHGECNTECCTLGRIDGISVVETRNRALLMVCAERAWAL